MAARVANDQDIDSLIPLAEQFWTESGYADSIPFDADSSRDYFNLALDAGLLVVAEYGGEAVGFAAGVAAPCIVNRAFKVGAELAWWIKPEQRGGVLAIRMLRLIENQAFSSGCKIWSMMLLNSLGAEKVESLYLREGYEPAEKTFVKIFH